MTTNSSIVDQAEELIADDVEAVGDVVDTLEEPIADTIRWLGSNWEGLLIGALVAVGLTLLMMAVRYYGRAYRARTKDRTSWKGIVAGVFAKTTVFFMLAAAFDIVVNHTQVPDTIEGFFDTIFLIAAALQGAIWARELVLGIIKSKAELEDDPDSTLGNALNIIRVLVNVAVFAIAIVIILSSLGVNVVPLVTGLGIGGIAIGLAAQGIFSDLFAALSIVFDRPFRKGDVISYGNTFGTVEKIGLKTTRLRAISGEQIVMGNTQLLEQEVKNIALAERRRVEIPFGVIYQTPAEKLKRMKAIVESTILDIEEIKPVRTICTGFGDSSIDFLFVYDHYTADYEVLAGTKSQVLIAVTQLFEKEGIEFAYPTQTTFTSAPDGTMIMPYPDDFGAMFGKTQADDTKIVAPKDAKVTVTPPKPSADGDAEGPGGSDL